MQELFNMLTGLYAGHQGINFIRNRLRKKPAPTNSMAGKYISGKPSIRKAGNRNILSSLNNKFQNILHKSQGVTPNSSSTRSTGSTKPGVVRNPYNPRVDRAFQVNRRLSPGSLRGGMKAGLVDALAIAAADKFIRPHTDKLGEEMGKGLLRWIHSSHNSVLAENDGILGYMTKGEPDSWKPWTQKGLHQWRLEDFLKASGKTSDELTFYDPEDPTTWWREKNLPKITLEDVLDKKPPTEVLSAELPAEPPIRLSVEPFSTSAPVPESTSTVNESITPQAPATTNRKAGTIFDEATSAPVEDDAYGSGWYDPKAMNPAYKAALLSGDTALDGLKARDKLANLQYASGKYWEKDADNNDALNPIDREDAMERFRELRQAQPQVKAELNVHPFLTDNKIDFGMQQLGPFLNYESLPNQKVNPADFTYNKDNRITSWLESTGVLDNADDFSKWSTNFFQ